MNMAVEQSILQSSYEQLHGVQICQPYWLVQLMQSIRKW